MICPVCDTTLRAIERAGIEVDICPGCKGIWLDRGELEKLLQREGAQTDAPVTDTRPLEHRRDTRHDDHDDRHDRDRPAANYDRAPHREGQRRRGSWLADVLGGLGGDD